MVSQSTVRKLADARSFERGQRYFAAGRVRRLTVDGSSVHATVDGTDAYRVSLKITPNSLGGRCSCPIGAEGAFCKHCVAVSLAWLEEASTTEPGPKGLSDKRLRLFLRGCDQEWLIDRLLAAAKSDPALRAQLASAAGHGTFDDGDVRRRLTRVIEIRGSVDYAGAYDYFAQVEEALDELEQLVERGFPNDAIGLAEYALELLETSAVRVDDSGGGLSAALGRAEEIHLAACAAGTPDPVELAERLVTRAVASDYQVFLNVLPEYEEVLGDAGLARYRELVEDRWRELPPKKPNDFGSGRYVITELMKSVAESFGGPDALIDVLARDVANAYDILPIAGRLCAEGRDDEALAWLERGLADFEPDGRLRALAADIHVRAGRRAQAGELLWANLVDRPSTASYDALREAMADDFAEWRKRALTLLAQSSRGRMTLIDVLLSEGEPDAAWQAAVDGGCSEQQWLRLARVRAITHPADAIPVLLRAADQSINLGNRDTYRVAAGLLTEAKTLFARCGRADDFRDHIAALHDTHRRKRALREELDRARLP